MNRLQAPDSIPPNTGCSGEVVTIVEHRNVEYLVDGITERLRKAGLVVHRCSASEAREHLPSCAVLMTCSAFSCDAQVIEKLPQLRGIAALAAGTESIDIKAATARGIPVAHAPTPANVTSMAEATVMLILAALYRLPESQACFDSGWQRPSEPFARTLANRTLGLVGFGKIARAVAQRLHSWGVDILAYSPHVAQDEMPVSVRKVEDLDEFCQRCDVISLHAAVTAHNRKLVDARFLSQLKPGAVLINTARGALVDEAALAHYCASGNPAFIALDCFAQEPLPDDSPLHALRNRIFTPHLIGHTQEVQSSLIRQGVENVFALLRGERPVYLRNPEVLSGLSDHT